MSKKKWEELEIRIGACEKCIQLILKGEEEDVKEIRKMFNETKDIIINNVTEIKDAIKQEVVDEIIDQQPQQSFTRRYVNGK